MPVPRDVHGSWDAHSFAGYGHSGWFMFWWIIGLVVWLCPALIVGMAVLIIVRRAPETRTQEAMGFWWDAQAKVWNPGDIKDAAHPAAGAVAELFDEDVRWPILETDALRASMDRFQPLLPGLPPAPALGDP
jgi:hypothetical protein